MSSRESVRDRLGGLWRPGCFGVPSIGWDACDGLCQGELGFGASLGARGRMFRIESGAEV